MSIPFNTFYLVCGRVVWVQSDRHYKRSSTKNKWKIVFISGRRWFDVSNLKKKHCWHKEYARTPLNFWSSGTFLGFWVSSTWRGTGTNSAMGTLKVVKFFPSLKVQPESADNLWQIDYCYWRINCNLVKSNVENIFERFFFSLLNTLRTLHYFLYHFSGHPRNTCTFDPRACLATRIISET